MVVQYPGTIFLNNLKIRNREKNIFLNEQWREHERKCGEQLDEHVE
jgi:hypothetical protein